MARSDQRSPQVSVLTVVLVAAAEQSADPVERIITVAAVPGLLVLDVSADIVDGGEAQPHETEGIQHPHRVRQGCAQGAGLAPVGI